jgi:probable DNA metabolism protein
MKHGKNVEGFHSDGCVNRINNVVRQVICEKHKFVGILRFKLLKDGIYYASMDPDNNIAGLLGNHFKKRFGSQKWLIHDTKRNIGVFYDLKTVSVITIDDYDRNILSFDNESGVFHENEIEFQNLWKTYFKNICIKERINPRLQRQFIPERYWKYLVEKN